MTTGPQSNIEEKYKFIVNAYGELMTLINRNYVYELVNDSLCRAFGKSRQDFLGKTVAEVWGDDKFLNEIKVKIDRCFDGQIFKEEDTFMIPGGDRRYYSVTYYPYRDKRDVITHVVGVTDDITERKLAEMALKKSEEELRILNEQKDKYLSIINSDLKQAADYVRSLLPDPFESPNLGIQWKIVPSAQLGGDSFGYHWVDEDHFAIYILDVTGHGLDAALHSVSALNTLKFQNLKNTDFRDPAEVLKGLNLAYQMTEATTKFITMWYVVYIPTKDELIFAGAGHPPLLIYEKGTKPVRISSRNIMIGVETNYVFRSDRIKLGNNCAMYMYTDGVYEVKLSNGKMMTLEDLEDYLAVHFSEEGGEIRELYEQLVTQNPMENLEDDFTMLKVNIIG